MNIQIIAVGRLKERYLSQGVEEYAKRLRRYGRFKIVEVREESFNEPLNPNQLERILQIEGKRILAQVGSRDYVVALDRLGKSWSSEVLARKFQTLALGGVSQIDFVIGGSLGLDSQVLERANMALSFSKFTFPHQLMRLILIEQIYRAFTIGGGERYHK